MRTTAQTVRAYCEDHMTGATAYCGWKQFCHCRRCATACDMHTKRRGRHSSAPPLQCWSAPAECRCREELLPLNIVRGRQPIPEAEAARIGAATAPKLSVLFTGKIVSTNRHVVTSSDSVASYRRHAGCVTIRVMLACLTRPGMCILAGFGSSNLEAVRRVADRNAVPEENAAPTRVYILLCRGAPPHGKVGC